jgi:class 3 adenylate cyclase/tetratricopeptide (TPR) repeat protein/type II secretory pathway predicted ATPase ExeA
VASTARKVVTVLFADVSGFTALGEQLDPESLQQLMGRWFRETQRIIERHHGTVEKYMGDAVMAVFGVPVVHEDDAVRAARAALEMRETLVELNDELARRWGVRLEIHTGLNTGEVVVGSAPGGDLSTVGDAVNVAQRLEAAAPPGEALVGAETAGLLEGAAQLDPIDPLTLKGKALPVAAWRLVSVESERAGAPGRAAPPFVGRARELRVLRHAFDEASASEAPRMITVLGQAGIGKSRLVRAFLADVRDEATTVVGRCLPYGDGITYWPVAEIVRTLSGAPTEHAVASLAGGDTPSRESELVASRISRAAGFVPGTVSIEEAQWAMRKLLETIARERPLVVVVEDIHWAEPSLLDLLEHVATLATGVPLLLLCLARPELIDEHPSWADAGERGEVISLEPLSAEEADTLLARLAGGEVVSQEREQLLTTAEGNPFFLQQMVAMRAETPGGAAAIPPTIQAVLTSRIDRLPDPERTVIERASIEGRTFHRGAVAELLPDTHRDDLDGILDALARRGLIRPGRSEYANERAYRFEHILIRDATYSLTSKRLRADLHERHATWLEQRSDYELGKHEELAGYHLEQALRCRLELEPAARARHRPLAARGADHLGTAGRGALAREDMPAAINLLERAIALLPEDDAALGLLMPEFGTALTATGRLSDAERVLDAAVEAAARRGDGGAEAHATVARLFLRLQVDTEQGTREVRERFEPLLSTFAATDDHLGSGRLWRLRGLVHWIEARSASADTAWQRAAEHSRLAGDEPGWSDALNWLASSAHTGPTPAEEAIARCESIRAQLRDHPRAQAMVLQPLAALRAMRGEVDPARELLADSNATIAEFGVTMHTAVSHHEAQVSLLAGDAAGAEAVLRAGYERLDEMGEKALLADTAAMLAQVLCEQGRADEAWAHTQETEDAAADDDLSAQIVWRSVRARLLARRGEIAEAKRISAEAVDLAARTDWLCDHAEALLSQGEVHRIAGKGESAAQAIREAIALYDRKGNTIGARRARSALAVQVPA